MKAIEEYDILNLLSTSGSKSVDEALVCESIQMKAIEQYFHVVLFIMLYKVALTFKTMGETSVCDESYWVLMLYKAVL